MLNINESMLLLIYCIPKFKVNMCESSLITKSTSKKRKKSKVKQYQVLLLEVVPLKEIQHPKMEDITLMVVIYSI